MDNLPRGNSTWQNYILDLVNQDFKQIVYTHHWYDKYYYVDPNTNKTVVAQGKANISKEHIKGGTFDNAKIYKDIEVFHRGQ